jgi:hypothetical protein
VQFLDSFQSLNFTKELYEPKVPLVSAKDIDIVLEAYMSSIFARSFELFMPSPFSARRKTFLLLAGISS